MPKTFKDIEKEIKKACVDGILSDWRDELEWGKNPDGINKSWKQRKSPEDILGACIHHTASENQDPHATNNYHIQPNHISDSGAPHICYTIGVSREYNEALLFNSFSDICWSQAKPDDGKHPEYSGDENRHLVSIVVFGDFYSRGHYGKKAGPTNNQMETLEKVCFWLKDTFGISQGGWFGHQDFGKSACPGAVLFDYVEMKRAGREQFVSDKEWQEALLRWNPLCLPKYGADGDFGYESKSALVAFEKSHKHKADGIQDPFIELLLIKKHPAGK